MVGFPRAIPTDLPEKASERVRTNSRTPDEPANSLFYRGRHRWLGLVARDRRLKGGSIRVAILIWEHLNAKSGYAWPSFPYIGQKLGLHRATVIRSIADLEEHGWLAVERNAGRHRGNRYRISFGRL